MAIVDTSGCRIHANVKISMVMKSCLFISQLVGVIKEYCRVERVAWSSEYVYRTK